MAVKADISWILESHPLIDTDIGLCGGNPVIKGTKVRTQTIYMKHRIMKKSIPELLEKFPELSTNQVKAAIDFERAKKSWIAGIKP